MYDLPFVNSEYFIEREEQYCAARKQDENFRKVELSRFDSLIGTFIAVKVINDGDTRVFIYSEDITDDLSKNGWFKTFTISDKPMNKGIWLALFKKACYDANWHLNFHVTPVKFMGIGDNEPIFTSTGWKYFTDKNLLNMVTTFIGKYDNRNEIAVFEKLGGILGFKIDEDPEVRMKDYIRIHRNVFPVTLLNAVLDNDNPITIDMVGEAYDQPHESDIAISRINRIRAYNDTKSYPGICAMDHDTCISFTHNIQFDSPYANADFIVNTVEKMCIDKINDRNANKQRKADIKKEMSQYHKEIKKIVAAHLNKRYEASSMEAYQTALNNARSACKRGSSDIEDIMDTLRKAESALIEL